MNGVNVQNVYSLKHKLFIIFNIIIVVIIWKWTNDFCKVRLDFTIDFCIFIKMNNVYIINFKYKINCY